MKITEIRLGGIRIHKLTLSNAVTAALDERDRQVTVMTPNAIMLEQARKDASLQSLLNSATLSLPDGKGVLIAAKRQGTPISERVSGIDFGKALMERAERDGLSVFLLGGKPGVAFQAAQKIKQALPRLQIAGVAHGYFAPRNSVSLLQQIQDASPDILFVCLGFPMQEQWTVAHQKELSGVRVIACLGGSLDVWGGYARRAPLWMQKTGLEWLYRMIQEPSRLSRLPHLLSFIWHFVIKIKS